MIGYQKSEQTKKSIREEKVCSKCGVNRKIKFFEKPTSKVCNDCKKKSKRLKKQKSIGKLKKELETLVKKYVKQRDGYICQKCDLKVEGLNAHGSHVIPVSRSQYLRFDPLNIKTLCYKDHIGWWHKNPLEASAWFKEKFPDRYEYLQKNKNITHVWTVDEIETLIQKYKKLLKQS